MKRTLITLTAGAAALAFAAGCGGEETEEHDLTFTTDAIEVEAIDEGDRGSSRGDLRAFTQELYEEGSDEPVGRLDGTVAITDVTDLEGTEVEYRMGSIQYTLDDGTIVATGNYIAEPGEAVPYEGGVERAIVGGTGDYEGASGVTTQTADGDSDWIYELEFTTPSD